LEVRVEDKLFIKAKRILSPVSWENSYTHEDLIKESKFWMNFDDINETT
jgi:hypothetical protein